MKISNWTTNVANQSHNDLDWARFTCFVANTYQSQITLFWGKISNWNFCLCKKIDISQLWTNMIVCVWSPHLRIKCSGPKMCLCKICDKYEVCVWSPHLCVKCVKNMTNMRFEVRTYAPVVSLPLRPPFTWNLRNPFWNSDRFGDETMLVLVTSEIKKSKFINITNAITIGRDTTLTKHSLRLRLCRIEFCHPFECFVCNIS